MVLFPHTWNSFVVKSSKNEENRSKEIFSVSGKWVFLMHLWSVKPMNHRVDVLFSFFFSTGVNPSSLMNLFTYEKGFCFVSYLSQLCGDIKRFDTFLRVRNIHLCSIICTVLYKFIRSPVEIKRKKFRNQSKKMFLKTKYNFIPKYKIAEINS